MEEGQRDGGLGSEIEQALRVGVHWSTETARQKGVSPHRLCQVFCSAVPAAYDNETEYNDWGPFAAAILTGAYEATLAVGAVLAMEKARAAREQETAGPAMVRQKVFLIQVGGGVFGNHITWIASALKSALERYRAYPLDVYMVHFESEPTDPLNPYMQLERQYH